MLSQLSTLTWSKISEAAAISWLWSCPNSSILSSSKVVGLHWLCWLCWLHSLSDLSWHFGDPAMSQHIWSLQGSAGSAAPHLSVLRVDILSVPTAASSSCPLISVIMMAMVTTVLGHKGVCCPPLKASSLLLVKPVVWDYELRPSFLYETLQDVNTYFCKWWCAQQLAKAPSFPVLYEPVCAAGGQHGKNGIQLRCSAKCNIQSLHGHIGTKLRRNTRLCDIMVL